MARLQILQLPEGAGDDRPPFILVIDDISDSETERFLASREATDGIAKKIGAQAVVAFHGMTCDIPYDGAARGGQGSEVIERLKTDLEEARGWARHGYEIGQRHCGWTDHGTAPKWLTSDWPPDFGVCDALKRAVEYDEALTRVRSEPTEPEIMNAQQEHPDVWRHGYRCGVLAAKAAARREPAQADEAGG
ncbi:hypothetical protein [Streptomyces sp. 1222.5]|uniref:hypothetical protein n=1 Tax=Streptomyces sp. 1222.5 TaxID=1881026 RepID=UPI003EB72AFE